MLRPHIRSIARCLVLTILLPVLLFCCTAPVTSGGVLVTNEALATAVRTIRVAEIAMVAAADGLTAGYKGGLIPASVLQQFQSQIAPRLSAALAMAKVAIKTAEKVPGSTLMETVVRAVLNLQDEMATLQQFWTEHALILHKGVTP